jgi:hypothetical protein
VKFCYSFWKFLWLTCFHIEIKADRLINVSVDDVRKAFQVNDTNPLEGLEGRSNLLSRLGQALKNHPEFFGGKDGLV